MALTKIEEMQSGCIARAADDEPVFVLRAQDMLSADLVREWADLAEAWGCGAEKVQAARAVANAMERWPTRKYPD